MSMKVYAVKMDRPVYTPWKTEVTEEGIFGFFGDYRWLSNFHPVDITIDGRTYSSSEAAYMSRKTHVESEKEILSKLAPREAKQRGKLVVLREDWEEVKYDEMLKVLRLKFQDETISESSSFASLPDLEKRK
jgi:predicted NAD-dependent protein-ADP-ribosyltransferase YbiA (DUF1768 family)